MDKNTATKTAESETPFPRPVLTKTLQDEITLRPAETCHALLHGVELSIRTRRGLPGKLVFLVWVALCFFEARAYSQTGIGETLSGPDSHETGQGPHGHP